MRLQRTAVAATLAVAAMSVPASATPPVRTQVWEIVRTSSAPSNLAVSMSVGYVDSRTILALTYLRHERSGVKVLPGAHLTSREGTSTPAAYAAGEMLSCAAVAGACTETKGVNITVAYYNDSGRNDPVAPDTVIVVTHGRDAKVSLANGGKQWRVRKVTRNVRAFWSTDDDTSAGLWHSAAGLEVFTKASVKGGPRGSVAIGVPPCSATPVGLAGGAGEATLSGGVAPVKTSCPQDVLRPSQIATKATTWTFAGTVAGLTAEQVSEPGTVRLLVVDF
jgi:hypothetical protein